MPRNNHAPRKATAKAESHTSPQPRNFPLPARAAADIAPSDRAISKREFCALLNIGASTLYDRIAKGLIPPPLRILSARTSRWLLSDAQKILDAAKAERDANVQQANAATCAAMTPQLTSAVQQRCSNTNAAKEI